MNDFDINTAPPLSALTIAYAAMFYAATAVLLFGLLIQTIRLVHRAARSGGIDLPETPAEASRTGRAVRLASEVFLLRSTFFSDRWAWIFGTAFHIGLLLVLVRHLRYFLEPDWLGPFWKLLMWAQPFGFYGGIALPLGASAWWIRQAWLRDRRVLTSRVDHAVLALLVVIPVVGYINSFVRTDLIAVKGFIEGLLTFDLKPLPADPVLLLHLWLVALLMILLPVSRLLLLLPFGRLLHLPGFLDPEETPRRPLPTTGWAAGVILLALLGPPAAIAAVQVAKDGIRPEPDFATLVDAHQNEDSTVMIRFHPRFLLTYRATVMYQGKLQPNNDVEHCASCHAVLGADGTPVAYDNPHHFCGSCHRRVAVTIDCYECHNFRLPKQESALPSANRLAALPPATPAKGSAQP